MMTHLNSVETICQGKGNKKNMEPQIPRQRALQFLWTREKRIVLAEADPAGTKGTRPLHLQGSSIPSCAHSNNKSLQNSLKYFKTSGEKLVPVFRLTMHANQEINIKEAEVENKTTKLTFECVSNKLDILNRHNFHVLVIMIIIECIRDKSLLKIVTKSVESFKIQIFVLNSRFVVPPHLAHCSPASGEAGKPTKPPLGPGPQVSGSLEAGPFGFRELFRKRAPLFVRPRSSHIELPFPVQGRKEI